MYSSFNQIITRVLVIITVITITIPVFPGG